MQRWLIPNRITHLVLLGFILAGLSGTVSTVSSNLADRNIRTGFGFLDDRAGFAIGETLITYGASSSYANALLVGLANTVLVSALCIVISTLLGFLLCVGRLSCNWLLARLSELYIEVVRNIPLLLQMFVWYAALIFGTSPFDGTATGIASLDNRGIHLPFVQNGTALIYAAVAAILAFFTLRRFAQKALSPRHRIMLVSAVFAVILAMTLRGVSLPQSGRFGVENGLSLSTEFVTLIAGLSVYTSAYLAEIFRAAFLSVPLGQHEAAASLGLGERDKTLRIVLPQAIRVAIPPMTSWHLNTIKNSTLGVAIGYPEFVSVVDTIISQTGQAIEGVGLIVATFLLMSLGLAFVTDRYAKSFGWTVTGQAGRQASDGTSAHAPIRNWRLLPAWARRNLFPSLRQCLFSLVVLLSVSVFAWSAITWLVIDAAFTGGAAECRLRGGACWPFLRENMRLILFGTYPEPQQWRAAAASMLLVACLALSFAVRLWGRRLILVWLTGIACAWLLMRGGFRYLELVPMDKWSGLPVTLLLASIAVVAAFPLAVLLAFARRSVSALPRRASTALIEVMRGTPLVGVLFFAAVMFPLFVPTWLAIDSLPRVQLALILFTAAYMAEAIRGGLLSVSTGQVEAAQALGLTKWQGRRHVVLPQALKVSLPGLVNTSISEVKNTTLVLIVGVFDLLQTTRLSFLETQWRPYFAEAYLFTGTVFFAICFSLSRLSMKIERKLSHG